MGTVQAVHEATVGSRLLARVVSISPDLKAGQPVKEDDVLLQFDKTALEAKVKQAKSAVAEAEAPAPRRLPT